MNSEVDRHSLRRPRGAKLAGLAACVALVAALPAGTALAGGGGVSTDGGGGGGGGTRTVAGDKAKLRPNGKAVAPRSAPPAVKAAIAAANRIDDSRYVYGGGHKARGYDCSGAVSYALGPKGARIQRNTMVSGQYASFGRKGRGKWITWYGNSGHVFVVIAGLRFDTSQPDDGESGPGWSRDVRKGFANVSSRAARHKGRF